jgi:hypothetical protein
MPGRPRGLRTAARAHRQAFFPRYNIRHRHSALGPHTAADVRHGTAGAIQASRARVLTAACSTHPERFARKPPVPPALPATSWISPPQEKEDAAQKQPRDGASHRLTGSVVAARGGRLWVWAAHPRMCCAGTPAYMHAATGAPPGLSGFTRIPGAGLELWFRAPAGPHPRGLRPGRSVYQLDFDYLGLRDDLVPFAGERLPAVVRHERIERLR